MKDFIGQELHEGDIVAFAQPKYRNLVKGKIVKITACKIKLEHYWQYCQKGVYTHTAESSDVVLIQKAEPLS